MLFSPVRMHIPDGFLSVPVAVIFWVISIAVIAIALRRVNRELGEREVPLMGVLAAAIFAGQMLNFSVTGGTSGHLLGAALATILLGPWASVLILTCVVGIQGMVFQDGGLLVMGANLFNMAVVGSFTAYTVYHVFQKLSGGRKWGLFAGSFAAAWCSIFISSLSAALQLVVSGTSPANLAVPAMAGVHALIGTGEGLITLGAVVFLYSTRRDIFQTEQAQAHRSRAVWLGGALLIVLLAVASPLASTHPDGLEWVAGQQGFIHLTKTPILHVLPGYVLPGISNSSLATILASLLGAILVLLVALGVGFSRRGRKHDH
jgi:cobalt/nickel transport system permease protein